MKAPRTLLGMRGITIGRKQRIRKQKSRIVISLVLATFALTCIQSAKADMVTDWNVIATDAAVAPVQGSGSVVPHTRTFAMMHAAVHDALNAIDRRYQPYDPLDRAMAAALHMQAQVRPSADAAVATAAHHVLVHVLPSAQQPLLDDYNRSLSLIPAGPAKDAGIAIGEAAAAAIIVFAQFGRVGFGQHPIHTTTWPRGVGADTSRVSRRGYTWLGECDSVLFAQWCAVSARSA